jgi:hypothetical protein
MLGEMLTEAKGRITGQRVLSADGPKIEASFTSEMRIKGIDATEMGTFTSVPRQGGVMFGEGSGVIMSKDGEMISWSGNGIGRQQQDGNVAYRGAVYFQTSSTGKFATLNNTVVVFEFNADAAGNTMEKSWEWK